MICVFYMEKCSAPTFVLSTDRLCTTERKKIRNLTVAPMQLKHAICRLLFSLNDRFLMLFYLTSMQQDVMCSLNLFFDHQSSISIGTPTIFTQVFGYGWYLLVLLKASLFAQILCDAGIFALLIARRRRISASSARKLDYPFGTYLYS